MTMKTFVLLSVGLLSVSYQVTAVDLLINNNNFDNRITRNISDHVTLHCNVINNTAEETLIWYRGTQQVDIKSENSVNSSKVCIPKLAPEDNGVSFTCLLKSNTSMKRSMQLNVLFTPILTGGKQISVELGKNAHISCGFKANPAATMFWRQNNSVVTFPSRFEQLQTSDSLQLTITQVEVSDTAYYTCVAVTPNGNETTEVFHLIVGDRIPGLPIEAIAAAVVVGALIIAFGLFARRDKIITCKKNRDDTAMHENLEKLESEAALWSCWERAPQERHGPGSGTPVVLLVGWRAVLCIKKER